MKQITFLLITLLITFISCGDSDPIVLEPYPDSVGEEADFQKQVIDFGLSTFKELVKEEETNVLISPLSLEAALYMTMNGCSGQTLEEFRTTMKAETFYPNGMNPHYKELIQTLAPGHETTSLGIANTIFYDEGKVEFRDEFKDVIKDTYDGDFNQANFADPTTVDLINDWVKDNTENRIEKVLDAIQPEEALFLINALFFTATWKQGFNPNTVNQRPFTLKNGDEISVDMMNSDNHRWIYYDEEFQAVDMKFEGEEYSMTFILPNKSTSVSAFINGYDDVGFYDFYKDLYENKLYEGRVYFVLPKFEIEAHKNMNDVLKKMGLETAFTNANLSRMGNFTGKTNISRVLHDTYLKIDENGVEGGAATTVGVAVTSAPPSINLNRPFLFVIRHIETNTPIFIGKIGDPS